MDWIDSIVHGIKNVLYWLPVIWKDQDWDYHYLLTIVRHKLNAMEIEFREDDIVAGSEKNANQMHRAILLLDRILEYRHTEIAYRFHYQRWGWPEWVWKELDNGYAEFVTFWYPNANGDKEQERANREGARLARHAMYLENQDYEHLLTVLRKHLRGWWI